MKFGQVGTLFIAGGMLLTSAGLAQAGGFGRGTADTDILYEPGNFNMRAGVTYVNPNREYTVNPNPALVGTSYTDSYVVPSVAFMARPFEPLACAGTFVQAYGGAASYASPTFTSGKLKEEFTVNELGLTCSGKFSLSKGNFYILGGVFNEQFSYDRTNVIPAIPGATAGLELSGNDFGYRVGAAYDIPEIAFRTQLMYRSGTSYGADGTLTVPGAAVGLPVPTVPLPAIGIGHLPQSVELDVQSGIAPGWLAFASVKWTDWSVQDALVVQSPAGETRDTYNWKDGWTVTGGIGHQFTDKLAGSASLTWDQGVGTGWDLSSDTWTLSLGGSVKDPIGGEIRLGVGISYLTSAEETQYGPLNSAVDSGWAFGVGGSYKLSF